MTFGEKLLNLRRARGWTQEELADKIGVTRQALSKWESSSALPDTKNVVALAKLFGVTTDYLLCGDDGAEPGAPAQGNVKGGDGKNKAIALGLILLALGLAGLFALGIAGSFFDTIFVVDGREYRYMAAMLRANKFIILLLIIAVASALAGAVLLFRQAFRKKLDESASVQAEIRAMREKEAEAQRRELYDSVKEEIRATRENAAKKDSGET